jgi:hypothetical protein
MNVGKTKILTRLSNRMISINHSLNVINSISHLIRADKRRNTQLINGAKKHEVLIAFPNNLKVATG